MPWIQDTGRRTPPGTLQQPSNNNNNNNQFFLQNRPLLSPGGLKVPQVIANHFGTTLASVRKRTSGSLLPSRLQARLKQVASTGPIEMPTQLKVG